MLMLIRVREIQLGFPGLHTFRPPYIFLLTFLNVIFLFMTGLITLVMAMEHSCKEHLTEIICVLVEA